MRFFDRSIILPRYFPALFLVLTLVSCSPPPEQTKTVALSVTTSLLNSLIWIAHEKDYFKEQGLDIKFKIYPSGKRALDGMLAGVAEISTTAEVPFIAQLFAYPDLRIIATLGSSDNELKIVARSDRGIEEASDLKGKIIATQHASSVHFFLHLFLLQHYISEQEVTIQFMKAEELPVALAEGRIDAFSMREPFIRQVNKLLSGDIKIFSEPALYRKTYNLLSTDSYIQKNPEVVKKLLKALLSAEKFIAAEPNEAKSIMARLLNAEKDAVNKLWDNFVLRVVLEQGLLLQLQQQKQWSEQFALKKNGSQQPMLQSLHIDSLFQVAPNRVGLNVIDKH